MNTTNRRSLFSAALLAPIAALFAKTCKASPLDQTLAKLQKLKTDMKEATSLESLSKQKKLWDEYRIRFGGVFDIPTVPYLTVNGILALDSRPHDAQEAADAGRFLIGEQWDSVIVEQRLKQGRPTLTVNRMDGIKSRIIAHTYPYPSVVDLERLNVILYRRGREPQRMFNYAYTCYAEAAKDNKGHYIGEAGRPRSEFLWIPPMDLNPLLGMLYMANIALFEAIFGTSNAKPSGPKPTPEAS